MTLLSPGDRFPELAVALSDGQTVQLPEHLGGYYGVILFYRGAWCPYCNAQLRAFQRAQFKLTDRGIKLIALSVDDEQTTRELVERHGLSFPMGHGADAARVAGLTGAFVNPDPVYLQSTGFVLDPTGRIVTDLYSSGAIGRLLPDEVVGLVAYVQQHLDD